MVNSIGDGFAERKIEPFDGEAQVVNGPDISLPVAGSNAADNVSSPSVVPDSFRAPGLRSFGFAVVEGIRLFGDTKKSRKSTCRIDVEVCVSSAVVAASFSSCG